MGGSEEIEKSYVVEGARLRCSLGTLSCLLQLPIGHGVYTRGRKQANVGDQQGGIQISSFGVCQSASSNGKCNPMILMKWKKGKEDMLVEGEAALMSDSFCTCLEGGVITIEEDGQ